MDKFCQWDSWMSCSQILRANNLVVESGFAKTANFSGMNFVIIKNIIQIIADFYAEYKFLKPIGFVGNGLIHNPAFVKGDSTILGWVEAVEENECVPVSAYALCFVPKHISDINFLIFHEMCHVIDSNFRMGISSSPEMQNMFGADAEELLADAYAEYKTSLNPSETAIAVGNFIKNFCRKGK